jgi:hypothetical protein
MNLQGIFPDLATISVGYFCSQSRNDQGKLGNHDVSGIVSQIQNGK